MIHPPCQNVKLAWFPVLEIGLGALPFAVVLHTAATSPAVALTMTWGRLPLPGGREVQT